MPFSAFAYVDPNLVSLLFQAAFAFVVGGITFFVIGPVNWVKNIFHKMTRRFRASKDK